MIPRADSEDSDQTGRMTRLTLVFAGRTDHFVGFVMCRLICNLGESNERARFWRAFSKFEKFLLLLLLLLLTRLELVLKWLCCNAKFFFDTNFNWVIVRIWTAWCDRLKNTQQAAIAGEIEFWRVSQKSQVWHSNNTVSMRKQYSQKCFEAHQFMVQFLVQLFRQNEYSDNFKVFSSFWILITFSGMMFFSWIPYYWKI